MTATNTSILRERVTVYRCVHCRRSKRSRKDMLDHVRHCFRNPERAPRVGELTHTWQTGRSVSAPGWHYGVEYSVCEWEPHETMPAWWPGEGKIWDGTAWRDVPGYRKEPAPPGHMHPGGAPPRDVWPTRGGVPLDEVKPAHVRLAVLERDGEEDRW